MAEGWKQGPKPHPGLNIHRQLHTRPCARSFAHSSLSRFQLYGRAKRFSFPLYRQGEWGWGGEVTRPRPQREQGRAGVGTEPDLRSLVASP